MIKIPKFLSSFHEDLFAGLNDATSLQVLLKNWSSSLIAIPEVKEVILSFWSERDCFFAVDSSRKETVGDVLDEVLANWRDSGLHDHVLHDLKNRNGAISYSNFTWNYPSIKAIRSVKGIDLNFPRPYSILIPFSSFSQFTLSSEQDFYGYAALFFDEFPQMNEDIVQPVISLPDSLSAALSAYLRNKA